MDDATCLTEGFRYPVAVSVAKGKDRRIRLPRFLEIATPYVLVENGLTGQAWFGFCALDSLAHRLVECDSMRVIAEYRTRRPTIPETACHRHGLSGNTTIWLVGAGSTIEVLSESAWQAATPYCTTEDFV